MAKSVSVLSKVEGVARRREEQLIQKMAREKFKIVKSKSI